MRIYSQVAIIYFVSAFLFLYKVFKKAKINNELDEGEHLSEYERVIERKIRKKWLVAFLLMSVIFVLLLLATIFVGDGVESVSEEVGIPFGIMISTLVIIPWFWITYYCAFKKRGTQWLTWTMIMLPLNELRGISEEGWRSILEWNAISWFLFLIVFIVEFYYWINCFRLRKINSKRKQICSDAFFNDSSECSKCVSMIESSQNLNDLNEVFGSTVRQWPQWERQISKVYNKRKERLLDNDQL